MAPQDRYTFSDSQISRYLDRIQVPEVWRKHNVADLSPEEALEYLTVLQQHHVAQVPFENLTIHYTHHRQISIHPEELYKKIVADDNGRGGYCMENNCLLGTLLRSLGFSVYSAGARVYEAGGLTGWSHMINLVTIGDSKYHVDVGFGSNGPTQPLKLTTSGAIFDHIAPASMRLQYRNTNENTDPNQRLWVYEHRTADDEDFQPMYCYSELEFLPSDFSLMNYYTSTSPRTFFTQVVVAEKKIWEDGKLAGSVILGNDIKWRMGGKKVREIRFLTEDDRVKALEEHFGIKLGRVERESIRGLTSEIKNPEKS